jgi:ABC-type nickel/cobalt efflux system permease component RcnA
MQLAASLAEASRPPKPWRRWRRTFDLNKPLEAQCCLEVVEHMAQLWTGWAFALVLGVRHASEPDHLVAVSTLLAARADRRGNAWLGALWGVGHSLAILVVGGLLLVLRTRMTETVADLLELGVSGMLLVLGSLALRRAYRAFGARAQTPDAATPQQPHTHHRGADQADRYSGPTGHRHNARRPLLVGLVHGMAGSGALTALALASMPSVTSALIYLLAFGLGSVAGMSLLAGTASWPLRRFAQRGPAQVALNALAGTMSLVLGALWGWPLLCRLAA